MSSALTDVSIFATNQLSLLSSELDAEAVETSMLLSTHTPQTIARAGLAILNLSVSSLRTGMGGRTVVELALNSAVTGGKDGTGRLPEHDIRTGDIVTVASLPAGGAKKKDREELKAKGLEGVVTRVGERAVWIAVGKDGHEDVDVPVGKLWLVKLANDITYRRMNQTMARLQKMSEAEYTTFIRVLFGLSSPTPVDTELFENLGFVDPTLNESQQEAIKFALASKEVALIHGPPGTGKTHTLIELIIQMLRQNLRLLVCGPSNISVDNIVERLAVHKVPMIRLGHPARLLPSVLDHSLDVLTQTSEAAAIIKDVRKELEDKQASIRKTRNGRERRAIYADLKELRKEYREREGKCVQNLVGGSKIILATLHGAGGFQLKREQFDVVIIDEASQALEAQCWVPLLAAKKTVLAGDHLQLPPTIKSLSSKGPLVGLKVGDKPKGGTTLEVTLFDRLLGLHGSSIKRMLTTQYRMHDKIMRFPSEELYESKLIAAEAIKSRLLKDLRDDVKETEDTVEPLVFFDTQGGDFPEKSEEDGMEKSKGKKASLLSESKSNEAEAALVEIHVEHLVEAGIRPEDIGIVTPYNAQLAILSQTLRERYPGIELGSVDGFQGREKEAIIVSLVRSNAEREVGFLVEKRRLNVAMTRPKRHLCVIGDSETVGSGSRFLKRWMEFLEEKADLRYPSVAEVIAGMSGRRLNERC